MTDPLTPPPGAPLTHYRAMTVEIDRAALATRADGGADAETIPIALSSEYPVERYDWWEGERYNEVLDHSPEAVDLSRAARGLPFLDAHNAHDGAAQMGRIVNLRVEDRKLRGEIRFSARQAAQDYRRDMLDGIRTDISVGYRIDPNNLEISKADGEAIKTVRVKRWTPMEASGVAVPADPTVGVGRSDVLRPEEIAGQIVQAVRQSLITQNPAPKAEERHVEPTTTTAPANGAAPTLTVERDERDEHVRRISALAELHKVEDKLPKWIAERTSFEDVVKEIKTTLKERMDAGPQFKPVVTLTEKERKQYSYARAIYSAAEDLDCFERDVSQQIMDNLPAGYRGEKKGLFVPTDVGMTPEVMARYEERTGQRLPLSMRAGLDSKTSTTGTELKFVQPGSFIDLLRNKARVMQLGATVLAGLDGPITFPNQASAGTASWVAENPGSDVADSNLTFGTVSLSPQTLQSTTSFSKQLLRQAVVDVEALVRADLSAIHALAIDLAAIQGTGASNQPTGILTNTSVGVYTIGANGGAPTYGTMIGLEFTVENANANTGPMGYLSTPGIKATLKNTQVFATTNGVPVWLGGEEGEVNGYRAYSSKQVPSNLTKGTSTTVCHAIIFGVWSELIFGEWGAMEILVDPYRLKKQGMIEVTSFQMAGLMIRRPTSFAVSKDALSSF